MKMMIIFQIYFRKIYILYISLISIQKFFYGASIASPRPSVSTGPSVAIGLIGGDCCLHINPFLIFSFSKRNFKKKLSRMKNTFQKYRRKQYKIYHLYRHV